MDTIEGGKWLPDQELAWKLVTLAIERIRELENELGCFFDRNPDGTRPPEGVRRPDLRPHRAQGRPHRHRDHQPPRRAGVGARHRPARGASRGRADQGRTTGNRIAGVLFIDMRTGEYVFVRAKAVLLATGGGPTMYKLPHAFGRQELRRPRDGAARRAAAARHGDGAVPSDRPARRHAHAHDGHGARGRAARRGRLPARTARKSASCRATTRKAERATRDFVSRAMFTEMREGQRHARMAASTSR